MLLAIPLNRLAREHKMVTELQAQVSESNPNQAPSIDLGGKHSWGEAFHVVAWALAQTSKVPVPLIVSLAHSFLEELTSPQLC